MSIVTGLTAVVIAKNEEKNIIRCLHSLNFCDEVIVVDDESIDRTCEIAEQSGARVVSHKLDSDFSLQRNFGMDLATGQWVLYIDADEEVSRELELEITTLLTSEVKPRADAFYLKRRDYWWGKELQYGEVANARKRGFIRLVKKNSGKWQGIVHEQFVTKGKTSLLHNFINHYPHPNVKNFLQEINFYSSLRAKELKKQGLKTTATEIILYPLGKFLVNYILKRGFKDKAPGFAYAFFMSFHSFLVRSKLYQYWNIDE